MDAPIMTAMDVVQQRADDPRSPTYRRAENGGVEHLCCACREWMPATPTYFGFAGPNGSRIRGLRSRCRSCEPKTPSLKRRKAPPVRPTVTAGAAAIKAPQAPARTPRPAPRPVPTTTIPPSPAEAWGMDERQCRVCGAALLLVPDLWALRHDGTPSSTCRVCADNMRAAVTARRLATRWKDEDAPHD